MGYAAEAALQGHAAQPLVHSPCNIAA